MLPLQTILSYIVPVLRKGKCNTRYHILLQSVSNTSNTFILTRAQTHVEQKSDVITALINERSAVRMLFSTVQISGELTTFQQHKNWKRHNMLPLLTHIYDAHHNHTPRPHNGSNRTAICLPPTLSVEENPSEILKTSIKYSTQPASR